MPNDKKDDREPIKIGNKFVDLSIFVKPNSRQTSIILEGDELIFLTEAPPFQGRANASLIKYLSKLLEIPQSNIEIVHGEKERMKIVRIYRDSPEKAAEIILKKLKERK